MLGIAELFQDEEGSGPEDVAGAPSSSSSRTAAKVDKPPEPRAECGFVGLENQGATCYLNSLIQAMYMTPELRKGLFAIDPMQLGYAHYDEHEQERTKQQADGVIEPDENLVQQLVAMGFNENGCKKACIATKNAGTEEAMEWFFQHSEDPGFEEPLESEKKAGDKKKKKPRLIPLELQRLFTQLQMLDRGTISTQDLTTKGFQWQGMDGRVQHDAHELNRLLIDALERSLTKTAGQDLVASLYKGRLAYQTRCLSCTLISEREESYYDIIAQVKDIPNLAASLYASIKAEHLTGDNKYACDGCGQRSDALRSQVLRTLPPVLAVSLNRFEYDTTTWQRVKINDKFEFPLLLDMTQYVEGHTPPFEVPPQKEQEDLHVTQLQSSMVWLEDVYRAATACAEEIVDRNPHWATMEADADEREQLIQQAVSEAQTPLAATCVVRDSSDQRALYDLFAVILHRGGAYGGHYHAYIRDCNGEGRWTAVDDWTGGTGGGGGSSSSRAPGSGNAKRTPDMRKMEAGIIVRRESDLATLVEILQRAPVNEAVGMRCLPIAEVGSAFKARAGNTWAKLCKAKHGALPAYIAMHDQLFLFDESKTVCLFDVPISFEDLPEGPAAVDEEEAIPVLPELAPEDDVADETANDEALARQLQAELNGSKGVPLSTSTQTTSNSSSSSDWQVVGKKGKPKSSAATADPVGPAGAEETKSSENSSTDKEAAAAKKKRRQLIQAIANRIATKEFGCWFEFDDRKVRPMNVRDLQKAFQGKDSAYLLVYRARQLTEQKSAADDAGLVVPPPAVWAEKVLELNAKLAEDRERYNKEINRTNFSLFSGADLRYQWPLLRAKDEAHAPQPITVTIDARSTLADLKAQALEALAAQGRAEFAGIDSNRIGMAVIKSHLFNGVGGWHAYKLLDESDADIRSLLSDGADLLLFDSAELPLRDLPIGEDFAPLRLKVTLLGPGTAKPASQKKGAQWVDVSLPPVEVIQQTDTFWVSKDISAERLAVAALDELGLAGSRSRLHMVQRKSGGSNRSRTDTSFEVVPLLSNANKGKNLAQLGLKSGSELFVEDEEARGMHAKTLADAEIAKRNRQWVITIDNEVGLQSTDDSVPDQLQLVVDKDTTVGELRLMALRGYGLLSDEHTVNTCLRTGSERGVGVLNDESRTLELAGLKNGSSITLDRGAPPPKGSVLIKFCLVTDNDPAPQYNPQKPGKRGPVQELQVASEDTLVAVKEAMLQVLREQNAADLVPTVDQVRLRATNWMEEPGEALPEVDNDMPVRAKDLNMKAGELYLLEIGRVPLKHEISIQAYLWNSVAIEEELPAPVTATSAQDGAAAAETEAEAEDDSAADAQELATIMKLRHLVMIPVFECQETIMLQDLVMRLCSILSSMPEATKSFGPGAAAAITPDRMIIRELRSELLPGRTLWYGGPVSVVNATKSLKKLSIKGQRPLVIQLLDAPPRALAPGVLRLWAHRRLNPLADNGTTSSDIPAWPPMEVFVDGGVQPNVGHLRAALGQSFGIPGDRMRIAKYNHQQKGWTELHPPKANQQQQKGGRKKKGKQQAKKTGSLLESPYSLKEGDLLMIIDKEDDPNALAPFDRPEDVCARSKLGQERQQKRSDKKKSRVQQEIALRLGGDLNFTDDDEEAAEGGNEDGEFDDAGAEEDKD